MEVNGAKRVTFGGPKPMTQCSTLIDEVADSGSKVHSTTYRSGGEHGQREFETLSTFSELRECLLGQEEHILHRGLQSNLGGSAYRLLPHLLQSVFLAADHVLQSFYRVRGISPWLVSRISCVFIRRQVLNLVEHRRVWRVCHRATAFLTRVGGQAFQEAVGSCG